MFKRRVNEASKENGCFYVITFWRFLQGKELRGVFRPPVEQIEMRLGFGALGRPARTAPSPEAPCPVVGGSPPGSGCGRTCCAWALPGRKGACAQRGASGAPKGRA